MRQIRMQGKSPEPMNAAVLVIGHGALVARPEGLNRRDAGDWQERVYIDNSAKCPRGLQGGSSRKMVRY